MVTVLMYFALSSEQRLVLKEIMRVVKKKGKCVIIENNATGYKIYTLKGLIKKILNVFSQRDTEDNSEEIIFEYGQIEELLKSLQRKAFIKRGCPVFTLLLPLILLISKVNKKIL